MPPTPSEPAPVTRLRALDARPIVHEGRPSFALHDPLGLGEGTVVVPRAVGPLLALLAEGTRGVPELAAMAHEHYGVPVPTSVVAELVEALDQACLLDNDRSRKAHEEARMRWRALEHRPASHAGAVYPRVPTDLSRVLADHVHAAARHGDIDQQLAMDVMGASSGETDRSVSAGGMRPSRAVALLSPHIDYPRGGRTYGGVWARAAAAARAAELVIIVGTDHAGPHGSVTLTRQRYATPYGMLPTATEVVDRAASAYGADAAFAGELRHADEHSIELVALWLQHVRGGRAVPIVPLLVGGFEHYEGGPEAPERDEPLMAMVDVLRQAVAGRRALVVASGDLAHVGPAFGGEAVDGPGRARLAGVDGELLRRLEGADAAGFLAAIQRVENAYNVCGVAPTWMALQIAQPATGTVGGYQQCPADGQGRSWVSIAGAVFEGADDPG